MRHLGEAARWNPLVLVEALFQHPFPHHWCSNFHQAYVSADHASTIARASKTRKEDDDEDYNVSSSSRGAVGSGDRGDGA